VTAEALLEKAAKLAESLPQVTIKHESRASFLAAGKRFAWFLDDHHGDGMICLCVKTDPEEKEVLIEMDPDKYLRPAYVSRFGWMSIRLDRGRVDWDEIAQRLTDSYRIAAPRRLVKELDRSPTP
jgi:phosphoribosylglycinamide formyltransferase-1